MTKLVLLVLKESNTKLLNWALVVKPHNKTPYELFRGRTPTLSFMKPFGCHVTILNTLDHFGKFYGKVDEGTNSNDYVGTKEHIGQGHSSKETGSSQDYILMPLWKDGSLFDSSLKNATNDELQSSCDAVDKDGNGVNKDSGIDTHEKLANSLNDVNIVGPSINTASINFDTGSVNINTDSPTVSTASPEATYADFLGDKPKGDMSNINTTYQVPYTLNTRIHKDHSFDLVIGDVNSSMRIEQYFLMTNYSLWEVILNGDSPTPTRFFDGVLQPVAPNTAEQMLARKNELEARGTFIMALPDKHRLKFNTHKDAKTLMEAIEKRFGGNTKTKKRNKTDLEEQSLNDLFNSLKIYEAEVKSSSHAGTTTQNIAFVSSSNTDSTNESVSAAASVSAISAIIFASSLPNVDTLSNAGIYSFFASKSNSSQLENDDLKQIDANDLKEMDLKWQMAMLTVECYNCHTKGHFVRECRSLKDTRRNGASFQAEEEPTNYALMVFSSLSSSSDNEVVSCSKACTKAYAQLQSHYDKLTADFRKSQFDVISYQTGLESIEARFLVYQKNESVFKEDIKLLKLKVQLRDNALVTLRKNLKKVEQEWDDLKLNDDSFSPSPIYDRYHSGNGYHVVPPFYTRTFMPPKPDLVFNTVPNDVETDQLAFNVKLSPTKPDNDLVTKLRHANPVVTKSKSPPKRHINHSVSLKASNSPPKVTVIKALIVNAAQGNMSYLSDFKELNGGYFAFGGNLKGENKPNVARSGPTWLFDIDTLTRTMNYQPVIAGNQTNLSVGFQEQFDAEKAREEIEQQYVLFPVWSFGSINPQNINEDVTFVKKEPEFETKKPESEVNVSPSNSAQSKKHDDKTNKEDKGKNASQYLDDLDMPKLENITYSDDDDDVGAQADFNNLETSITVSPIPIIRVHKDHHVTQMIGDLSSAKQTREEGIDYEKFFAPVARINAIRLFLDYAFFMGFMMYQMDVKGAFLYGTIEKEVYVCQPLGFEDPDHPDKVYKVVKELYGLHQAPRAWYKTLANYLLENGFQKGKIDQTLFIKRQKGDIMLVQFYVDDIIFGFINKYLCKAFEKLMKDKFQMSSIGELTFFLVGEKDRIKVSAVDLQVSAVRLMLLLLEALVDKKKVVVTEASIRDALRLDDAEDVKCLPNGEIFAELARMGYENPSTKLTNFYTFPQQQQQPSQDDGISMDLLHTLLDTCTTFTRRVEHLEQEKIAQALKITKLKQRVKKLERRNKVKVLKLRRLQKVGTTQRIDTSDDIVMDYVSNQGRMNMDQDAGLVWKRIRMLMLTLLRMFKMYRLYTIRGGKQNPTLKFKRLTWDMLKRVTADPSRKRKGVVIRDPKESFPSTTIPTKIKSMDKGKGILVKKPKPLKSKLRLSKMKNMLGSWRALKRLNETPAEKVAKRQKLDEEVEELKRHIQIVLNEEDDVYTEATLLGLKILVVDYEIYNEHNKPYNKIKRADGLHQPYLNFIRKIEKEIYVCQPLEVEDLDHLDKVYKVVKALYGLHQAPRAWYETLANYLLSNRFHRGKIDQTLFIKRQNGDLFLVHVCVDVIIFGSTKKELCNEFKRLMKDRFQMSSMGELTFFLGLLVKQKDDRISISQDKYVTEPLVKDADSVDVDVYLYRSMIGSLMYLTASRQDIIDYARASLDRKSTNRGCQFLGSRLISWQCKKKIVVATSTTEAEYVATASCYGQKKHKSRRKQRKETKVPHIEPQTEEKVPTPSNDPLPSEEGLDDQKDASKQRMIAKIDVDKDLSLINETTQDHVRMNEEDLFEVHDLDGDDMIVDVTTGENEEHDATVAEKEVSNADLVIAVSKVVTTAEDVKVTTAAKDEENRVVIKEWDDVQATIDADRQLAEHLQAQEREQLSIEERSKLLAELIESRRKYFAAKRAEEIRNKPPTKAQQKTMDSKGMEESKKTQAEIIKGSSKRVGDEIKQESAKRQRLEKEDDTAELKRCLEIVPEDDDDVTIKATPISSKSHTIVDYRIYKEGKKS
nr:putative ribonuclease H-like domain-containing protein [Tanacetum cinerariifolium]